MTRSTTILPVLVIVLLGSFGCGKTPVEPDDPHSDEEVPIPVIPDELTSSVIAFVGVNVIPMTSETVLADQTILVRNGRVEQIGPSAGVVVPSEADRIEVEEGWLLPGLADMHTHMASRSASGENDLFLYIANGVTTVRVMEGDTTMLRWRDEIDAGTRVGPTMFVSGPPLDGADSGDRVLITHPLHISTVEEGRAIVAEHVATGYDFIKIYNTLEPDVYEAIMEESAAHGIKAVGHIPVAVTLKQAIAAGQYSAEHLNPFARSVVGGDLGSRWEGPYDAQAAASGAATIAAAGMWSCPTLAFYTRSESPNVANDPNLRYVSAFLARNYGPAPQQPTTPVNTRMMVKALHDAGAPMILGTWTGIRYLMPGFAVRDELKALTEAGLTPFEALQMATINAAQFMEDAFPAGGSAATDFGTVEVGRRADLILLEANPLENVLDVDQRVGVMVKGHWFSEKRLKERLEEIAASYGR